MSVEIAGEVSDGNHEKKCKEPKNLEVNQGDCNVVVNGISNGYNTEKHSRKEHKSEHKDKHKDREKHKDKHRDKDREREKEKHRDKSSSGKDKDKHSSSSYKEKDRERDKEKKHKDERKDRDREKEHKSSSSSKDKEHKSSSKDKHSSSSNKDKHSSSSEHRHKDKERDRDKERVKELSKDQDHEKDKEKHSSSKHSSSNKERHSSEKKHSEKDKHRSKEKEFKEKVKIKDEHKKEKIQIKTEFSESETYQSVTVKTEQLDEKPITEEFDFVNIKTEVDSSLVKQEETDDQISFNQSATSIKIKTEYDTEEDVPLHHIESRRSLGSLMMRGPVKRKSVESEDEDDVPLMARKKVKKEKSKKRKDESDEEDFKPAKKKKPKVKETKVKTEATSESPRKRKKEEETQEVWKWWEEEKKDDGKKWHYLEHKGPVFAPAYEKLPNDVKFYYDGKEMKLSEPTEEVATFYARMLDHDYTTKEAFNKNFFKDWRKVMTDEEKSKITNLSLCNFKHMHAYFQAKSEERKAMSKEEKKKIKEQNEELIKEYGFCVIDGHKERIGNFKIEPPGLFRGRGEHPKMGMLKRRVLPEDVIINCSKDSNIPQPPEGHKWREVRHDPSVTWLASWTENVQGQVKYVMLNPSSKLKGEKDWQKYETARKLAKSIDKIRQEYRDDWKSKEMRIRQRSVALYFIDKLALRAGNEKDEDQADTVGCCSLRVEHISLHAEKDGKENVVVFDFLGKDSIRYYNEVSVEKRVFKNLQLFMENKKEGDDLFDRLNTTVLNKHLNELMDGLTAKVFRTYNASITLQQQLNELTDPDSTVAEKILSYNRANRAVAILCNHQRAVPKTHAKSMENLKGKIEAKKEAVEEAEKQYKQAKREFKIHDSSKNKIDMDKRKKQLDRLKEQLAKLELQATDKEENKEIALGTSKLNYLDPRISVAWCKKNGVPIEKIYNKTQREKFRWAIDMAGPDYVF